MYSEVLVDLFRDWWTDPDYSHGFLVLPLSLYIFWSNRPAGRPRPDVRGLFLTLFAGLLYSVGMLGAEFFLTRLSLLSLFAGLLWTFWGLPYVRRAGLPLLLFASVIPLPAIVYARLAVPLQLFASNVSAWLLKLGGVPVLQHGNILELANMQIGVAEACSGLRSMSSLIVLALLAAYSQGYGPRLGALLVLFAVPIAILVNLSRVVGTALLVEFWDKDLAVGFYHSFAGWLVFLAGVGLLVAASALVNTLASHRYVRGSL